jgi:hypothetical protein
MIAPFAALLALAFATSAPLPADSTRFAAPPAPSGLDVTDVPEDDGHALELRWQLSPADTPRASIVLGYRIERATSPGGPWTLVDSLPAGVTATQDPTARRNLEYYYRVIATGPGGATPAGSVTGPVRATAQWFRMGRLPALAALALILAFLIGAVSRAENGWTPGARRVRAHDAIDEAVRRAAESGRALLFVPGTRDVDDLQTPAALDLLAEVARRCARLGARLRVPVAFPVTHALAEDVVRRAYAAEGREDALESGAVELLAPDAAAYTAAVAARMTRERPGAGLLTGGLSAEALMLAESAAAAGATTIGGTANVAQLPFLAVSCDDVLIGEELFSAGAVLSDDPRRRASRRAAELAIAVLATVVLIGCALETAGVHAFTAWLGGGTP